MNLQGRALYNLIRLSWLEDASIEAKPWQVEDLRTLSSSELFNRLKGLGIELDSDTFFLYAKNVSSPEDLAEVLWIEEEENEAFEQAYLLLFELWRRLLPEQQSLSTFCDELDHLFYLYDHGELQEEERLQIALKGLKKIIDEATGRGSDPQEVFAMVSSYCAHDLESFLYDYAADQIESGQLLAAAETIDGFADYVRDPLWFAFLRLVARYETDEIAAAQLLDLFLDQLKEEPDHDLLIETARFFMDRADSDPFLKIARQARPLIETEHDLEEWVMMASRLAESLQKDELHQQVELLIKERQEHDASKKLSPQDPLVGRFYSLLDLFIS